MTNSRPSNEELAGVLRRIADLLEAQDGNPHRTRAYRRAADRVRDADDSLAKVVRDEGSDALEEIPDIGEGISRLLAGYVRTGRSRMLDRLQGEVAPEKVFRRVPGIGDELAARIADRLEIETLEELERAAHDGRLADVEGFGPRRVESVKASLAGMLSPAAGRRAEQRSRDGEPEDAPEVGTLLDVDAEYRRKADAGTLKTIAPKRFNPDDEAWLPILHADRGDWSFTALYSNTARAHELGKTHDWVVLYYERDGEESQATVVTASRGDLEGKRVVRGRETECERYYDRRRQG